MRRVILAFALLLPFAAWAQTQVYQPPVAGAGGIGTVTSVTCGAGMTGGTFTTSGTCANSTNTLTRAFGFELDGGGSAITTALCTFAADGTYCIKKIPYSCTITEAAAWGAGQTGSAVVEVAKYTSYTPGTHPVAGDKITASAPITISSGTQVADSTLTGWTKSVTAGDWIAISLTSISTFKRLTVMFTCVES